METFTIKYRGMKVKVRNMQGDERINENTICRFKKDMNIVFHESEAIGDRVDEHPSFEYLQLIPRGEKP